MPELKVASKTLPEAEHVLCSITIRNMELPREVLLTKNSILRWLALSLGLLNENESRNTIVPVLDAFLYFQIKLKKDPTVADLKEHLDSQNMGMNRREGEGLIPEKAIRYHLGKLRECGLAELKERRYSLVKDPANPVLSSSLRYALEGTLKPAMERMERAFAELTNMY